MLKGRRSVALIAGLLLAWIAGPHGARAGSSPAAADDSLEPTLAKVVKIFGAGGLHNLEAYGTGFLVSPNGHVVTVWSHLLDSGDAHVVLNDGRRFTAKFVKGDTKLDLAVLKIEEDERDLPFFNLREAADPPPGTRVLAYSNMFKVATGDEAVSVVHGVIAVRTRLSGRRAPIKRPTTDRFTSSMRSPTIQARPAAR